MLFQSAVALKDVPPTNHEREDNTEEMVPVAGRDLAGGTDLHYDGPLAGYSVPPGIGYPLSAMNWPQSAHKVYYSYFEREEQDVSEDEDRYEC